jgi:hypothetical protein
VGYGYWSVYSEAVRRLTSRVSIQAVSGKQRSNVLEKNKDGKRSKVKLPDLRGGVHGEVTKGGLLGEGYRDPLAIEDDEVIVGPDSKLPAGQTARE